MKLVFKSSLLFCLILIAYAANSYAQQWSDEQKDVWAGVEKYWAAPAMGDLQGFLSYFDDSYMGWSNQSRVPQSKANTSKWIEDDIKSNTTVLYTITPLTIWVKGDFAYVHYTYSQLMKDKETGKKTPSSGTWTDILMKKGGKWVLIGDHGGRTSSDKNNIME
jgi:ketosteroid isomerase-like protein